MMKFKYILIITIGILYSCSKMDYAGEDISQLVVDGVFSPQATPVIKLNLLGDTDAVNQIPVTDANVHVFSGDKVYDFDLTDAAQGTYGYKGSDFDVVAGRKYKLEIEYGGIVLYAEAVIPYPVKNLELEVFTDRLDSLGFGVQKYICTNWGSSDNSFFYATLECDSLNDNACDFFYSSNLPFPEKYQYISTEGLIPGYYYKMIVYSMTEEYAQYYYGLPNSGDVGNIENAYGIFTGINSKSTVFQYLSDSLVVISK